MQTKGPLQVRIKEHKRATVNGHTDTSALAEHACQEGHEPDWDEAKSIAQVPHL